MKYKIQNETIQIRIGSKIMGKEVYSFNNKTWKRRYTIKSAEQTLRYGQDNVLLTVDIETVDLKSDEVLLIDQSVKRWISQLV